MNYRRALCLILTVFVVAFSLPFTVSANADELQFSGMEFPVQYEAAASDAEIDQLLSIIDEDALTEYIVEKISTVPSAIDVSAFNIPSSYATVLSSYIWYYMPEAFNVYGLGYYSISGRILSLTLTYRDFADTAEEFQVCSREFYDGADMLLEGIRGNDSLTELEKALLLHDRLAAYIEYDYFSDSSGRYTAYGAFGKKAAVCQGYTMAYMYLLKEVGIRSGYCVSEAMNHAWNIVYLDGVPYHTDVTWDDVAWKSGGHGAVGRIEHDNFLRSTEGIVSTGHDGGDFDETPVSTTYDDYYWQASETEFVVLSDGIYYIDNSLEKILKAGDSSFSVSVEDTWKVSEYSHWLSNYSCLDSYGDTLIYSLTDRICAYDISTGESKVIYAPELSGYMSIYGFTYEKGNLIIEISQGPAYSSYISSMYSEIVPYTFDCEHLFEEAVSDELLCEKASCISSAVYYKSCSLCGYASQETFSYGGVDENNHLNTRNTEGFAPTCTEIGRTEGVYCNDCRSYISGHEPIDRNEDAHKWDNGTEITAGTCTTASVIRYTCMYDSRHVKTESGSINGANHVNTINTAQAEPTCTEVGFTAGVYCKDCKTYISGHDVISIREDAHQWDNGAEITAGTCTTASVIRYTCMYDSHHVKTESGSINGANHVNIINTEETEPTCTENGYTEGVYCNDCKVYISGHEMTDKTAHKYTAVVTEATCASGGYTTYTCVCSDSYVSDYTDKAEHKDADGDFFCDMCAKDLYVEEEPAPECSHMCHKDGFMGFIWKIMNFFGKLFGTNPVCECGKAHY